MIGQRLYRARKAAGLSLRDLGARVGLTHAAITKYEDEQATPPSTTLLKLARALNVRT
jgi:transcriptional regulator with XRE-family HTH domain